MKNKTKQNWKKKKKKSKKTDNHMKAERKMHMHEGMIPKTDKKSSKENPYFR